MDFSNEKAFLSHGEGTYSRENFKSIGSNVILERGVKIFHCETITLGDNVYIGHETYLKGYYKNEMKVGSGTWIGQNCFFHSAGSIQIGRCVGIGPHVKILTSTHDDRRQDVPVMHNLLLSKAVQIGDGADIGVGSILLPGVSIGRGAIIGAGSVVTKSVPPNSIYAGVPAKFLRMRS